MNLWLHLYVTKMNRRLYQLQAIMITCFSLILLKGKSDKYLFELIRYWFVKRLKMNTIIKWAERNFEKNTFKKAVKCFIRHALCCYLKKCRDRFDIVCQLKQKLNVRLGSIHYMGSAVYLTSHVCNKLGQSSNIHKLYLWETEINWNWNWCDFIFLNLYFCINVNDHVSY